MNEREINYRREQIAREREARRRVPEQALEDALWRSLTPWEQRLWAAFSDAVARVQPHAG